MNLGLKTINRSLMVSLFFFFLLGNTSGYAVGSVLPRVYVMDTHKNIVQSVSFSDGTIIDSSKLDEPPSRMVLSPDGSRLIVFIRPSYWGPGLLDKRRSGAALMRPKHPHKVSIFNTDDMKLAGEIDELGWNATYIERDHWPLAGINGMWDAEGRRFTLLCWGKKGTSPEIAQIDAHTGTLAGRIALDCEINEIKALTPLIEGRMAALLYENSEKQKKAKNKPTHNVVLVNLHNIQESKQIELAGFMDQMLPSQDGNYLYVLAQGNYKQKSNEYIPAALHIISLGSLTLEKTIDGGLALSDAITDENRGRTIIVCVGKQGTSSGLIAVQGTEVVQELKLSNPPIWSKLSSKIDRLYLVCSNSVDVIDLASFISVGSIATPQPHVSFWDAGGGRKVIPSVLELDRTERLGFMSYDEGDNLTILDLKNLKFQNTLDITPGWIHFARAMGLAVADGFASTMDTYTYNPKPYRYPSRVKYRLPLPVYYSTMFMDPLEKYLYLLGDSGVDIIDIAQWKKIRTLSLWFKPTYGEFLPSGSGSILAINGMGSISAGVQKLQKFGLLGKGMGGTAYTEKIALVNTSTNELLSDQNWQGGFIYSGDGKYTLNFDSNNIYLLDATDLSPVKKIGDFKELRQMIAASGIDH
jgi:hypothetical protein